jgi:hypothetical protein
MTLSLAVIERARAYLNTDAPFLERIRQDSKLTAATVNEIAAEYLVRRNLGKEDRLQEIADHMNTEIASWPGDLVARAQWCLTCAASIKARLDLHHTPCSAVTKLAWFLRPTGWTLYDSFARNAVRSGGLSGPDKLARFYKSLEQHGFLDAADKIETILSGTPWSHLNGARVLDAYMMLAGGFPFRLGNDAARQGFLKALPTNSGNTLSTVAARIMADLTQHKFIKFVEQRH